MGSEMEPKKDDRWFDGLEQTGCWAEWRDGKLVLGAQDGGSNAYVILPPSQAQAMVEWLQQRLSSAERQGDAL